MKSILFREIKSFFGSPVGYLVIAVFLVISSLYLFVFDGDYNISNSGFADLNPFFSIVPLVFLFLIPAVTMRSFSDEIKQGTLELLLTKPLSIWQIVGGKYLAAVFLIMMALVPTLLYVAVVYLYGNPIGNIDLGQTLGSYFGLLFVISAYTAIGIFTSSLSENQIVAFLLALFLCFFLYFAFDKIAGSFPDFENIIASLGMNSHFESMSRGVLDTRDILYFLSITIAFLFCAVVKLKSTRN